MESGTSFGLISEMEVLQAGGVQLPHGASLHFSTRNTRPHVKRLVCTNSPPLALATPILHVNTPTPTSTQRDTPISPTSTSTPTPAPAPTHTPTPTPTPTPTHISTSNSPAPTTNSSRTPARRRTKFHPWLIVGIGNPGNKFHKTRHNVGFEMIDAIAEAEGIKLNTIQQKALTGKGEIGPAQVLLAKPQTYVNLTGQSIGPLAAYYRIPVQQILVIFDDMDLEFGLMRLATKGGHGGNNGMKSVIENLKGCRLFPRLRIGIGSPPGTMDPGAFVLQRFADEEREEIDTLIDRGPILIRQMITEGIEKTANAWNELRKSRMQLTAEELEILKGIC